MWYNSIIGTDFNPRSREGSDTMSKKLSKKPIDFNPRSREGSDPEGVYVYVIPKKFQSALPRGERRQAQVNEIKKGKISIHAPARGATIDDIRLVLEEITISIHAPARGATAKLPKYLVRFSAVCTFFHS